MSIESVMPSNHLILCHPLLLLLSIFPSIRVSYTESVLHIRWPKHWSFSFRISPSNKYSGLISLRFGWFDLLAVQRTLKSLLQYHSWKASILQCPFFVMYSAYKLNKQDDDIEPWQYSFPNLEPVHLSWLSRMSGSRWVITPSWLSGSWRSFFV